MKPRAGAPACTPAGRQPCRWSCNTETGLSCGTDHQGPPRAPHPAPTPPQVLFFFPGKAPAPAHGKQAAASPVGAAEAVALAGGEVGLVDGLHVGLGVGGRAAPRLGGAGPAAEQRGR